mgnify:FL=1
MRAMRAFRAAKALENEPENPREKGGYNNASITPFRTLGGDERRVDDSKAIGASSQRGQRGKLRLASLPGVEQQNTAQRNHHSHPASREAHGTHRLP